MAPICAFCFCFIFIFHSFTSLILVSGAPKQGASVSNVLYVHDKYERDAHSTPWRLNGAMECHCSMCSSPTGQFSLAADIRRPWQANACDGIFVCTNIEREREPFCCVFIIPKGALIPFGPFDDHPPDRIWGSLLTADDFWLSHVSDQNGDLLVINAYREHHSSRWMTSEHRNLV